MFELIINDTKHEAALSAYTLMMYEQEFGGADMLSDLDSVVLTKDKSPSWLIVLKGAWAALKTQDDTVPCFAEWSKTATNLNMNDI